MAAELVASPRSATPPATSYSNADHESGLFDHALRPGIAAGSNAIALLVRTGYPSAIIAEVNRRLG